MQRLKDQVFILWALNPVNLLIISWFCQLFLYLSFNAHLFQTFIIILFNAIRLRFGHRLIWLFSRSSKNSRSVIISVTRYSIIQLKTAFYFRLDSNFVQHKTHLPIVWDVSLLSFSSSSLLPSSIYWYISSRDLLSQLAYFFVTIEFLFVVIGYASYYLTYQFIFQLSTYKM